MHDTAQAQQNWQTGTGAALGAALALSSGPAAAVVQTRFLGPEVGGVFQGVDIAGGAQLQVDATGFGIFDITILNNFGSAGYYQPPGGGSDREFFDGSVRIRSTLGIGAPVAPGTTLTAAHVAGTGWQTLAENRFSTSLESTGVLDKGGGYNDYRLVGTNSWAGTTGEHLLVPFSLAQSASGSFVGGWVDLDIVARTATQPFGVHVHSVSVDLSGAPVTADRTYQALPFELPDPPVPVVVPVPSVPEPSSLLLLALGAAGLGAYRALKRDQDTAPAGT